MKRQAIRRDPAWLAELLACPKCHAPLSPEEPGWRCGGCGVVGRRTAGFPDFLADIDQLPMAGHDMMKLAGDEAAGAEMAASSLGFVELAERAAALQADAVGRVAWSARRRRACDRFHARLRQLNLDASKAGGEALLAKVDNKIDELGWPELNGTLALEAGGGAGFFLPAFGDRFDRVVMVDASLVNLVLAARLCEERELENVAFVRADVTALPFAGGRFDMVHENGVIEHVHSPQLMLAEAARVRSERGYVVCVSPNRFSIAPEPHFGLPLYGAVPPRLRRPLVPLLRGFDDGVGTDLLSLRDLRQNVAAALDGDHVKVFFLPRRLPFTARQTLARRLVTRSLATRVAGDLVDVALNRMLLGIVPQHTVIAWRGSADSSEGEGGRG